MYSGGEDSVYDREWSVSVVLIQQVSAIDCTMVGRPRKRRPSEAACVISTEQRVNDSTGALRKDLSYATNRKGPGCYG